MCFVRTGLLFSVMWNCGSAVIVVFRSGDYLFPQRRSVSSRFLNAEPDPETTVKQAIQNVYQNNKRVYVAFKNLF